MSREDALNARVSQVGHMNTAEAAKCYPFTGESGLNASLNIGSFRRNANEYLVFYIMVLSIHSFINKSSLVD